MNATLNISVPDSTRSVTDTLQTAGAVVAALGLSSTLTPTLSTVAGALEPGARVELWDVSPAEVVRAWHGLKTTFGLGCCWIVVDDGGVETYAGCIKGWWAYQSFLAGPSRRRSARFTTPWPADPNGPHGPSRSDYVRAAYSRREEV